MKYQIFNDPVNHPVFDAEPHSLDPSRVTGSDAYIIRANKRDQKATLKMVQRVKQTLRLKPSIIDTTNILKKFKQKRQTKNVKPQKLLQSDDEYGNRYELIDVNELKRLKAEESSSESEDIDFKGKSKNYAYKEKRYVKPTDELRRDIMNLFKDKEQWSWEEIKTSHLSDQPDAPLKKEVQNLCDKVTGSGNGNAAVYVLKSLYKF